MSFERLVRITADFYSWEEIAQAKGQLMADVLVISSAAELEDAFLNVRELKRSIL